MKGSKPGVKALLFSDVPLLLHYTEVQSLEFVFSLAFRLSNQNHGRLDLLDLFLPVGSSVNSSLSNKRRSNPPPLLQSDSPHPRPKASSFDILVLLPTSFLFFLSSRSAITHTFVRKIRFWRTGHIRQPIGMNSTTMSSSAGNISFTYALYTSDMVQ